MATCCRRFASERGVTNKHPVCYSANWRAVAGARVDLDLKRLRDELVLFVSCWNTDCPTDEMVDGGEVRLYRR